jgi:flagellar motor switch protein FliM
MPKTLSQEEIDALFSAAQAPKHQAITQRKITSYDLPSSRQLEVQQVATLTALHASLARRLANSLGAYLRVGFEMNFVSVEQLTHREFIGRIPELTYFASLHILPIDALAAFQTDLSLVFPIVDVILGGSGGEPIEPRDIRDRCRTRCQESAGHLGSGAPIGHPIRTAPATHPSAEFYAAHRKGSHHEF